MQYAREKAGEHQIDRGSVSGQPDRIDVAILVEMTKLSRVKPGEGDMRRDMELVRTILRAIQDKADLKPREIEIIGYDDEIAGRHIALLAAEGYIDGPVWQGLGDAYPHVLVIDLSWSGHDLAGALLTDDGVWQKVKAALGPEKLASLPLKMIQAVATEALTAWGLKQMGLS